MGMLNKEVGTKTSQPGLLSSNLTSLKKGLSYVESSGGKNLFNPVSSATGMYQILYNNVDDNHANGLTREEFAYDFALQDDILEKRFNGQGGFSDTNEMNMVSYNQRLKKDYAESIKEAGYTDQDLYALQWYLGKQGTREYLGYVIRDGKPLIEVFPRIFGDDAKAINKTPDEYVMAFREGIKKG